MISKFLENKFLEKKEKYPYLSQDNFNRIKLMTSGLSYKNKDSYPDIHSRIELFYTPKRVTDFTLMTFYKPNSPFSLVDGGLDNNRVILYKNEFVAEVNDFEERLWDMRNEEPFYFYVRELNGDLVLKINPVQLCDFFQNSRGVLPCSFCFRNDMVGRFRNISANDLIKKITKEEKEKNNYKDLQAVDEISIITGSYENDKNYLQELSVLVKGLLKLVGHNVRVVAGSHEGKAKKTFQKMKHLGVTTFAFPVESMDDLVRSREMRNRKGVVKIIELEQSIKDGIEVFGDDNIIVRLVAGMGDELDSDFRSRVKRISSFGKNGPIWNINIYMPFTHYHSKVFQKNPPYTLDYLYEFMSIINENISLERQMRFKVSP